MTGVLYVGTRAGLVLYRAGERGSWLRAGQVLSGQAVTTIVATDQQTLLVATGDGSAQQSFDGGTHWMAGGAAPEPIGLQVATIHGLSTLAFPRLSSATAYARLPVKPAILLGAGAGGVLLFRSNDDGIHWEPAGLPGPIGKVTTIVPAADKPGAAWAGTEKGELLRSENQGLNWRLVATEQEAILCLAAVSDS